MTPEEEEEDRNPSTTGTGHDETLPGEIQISSQGISKESLANVRTIANTDSVTQFTKKSRHLFSSDCVA